METENPRNSFPKFSRAKIMKSNPINPYSSISRISKVSTEYMNVQKSLRSSRDRIIELSRNEQRYNSPLEIPRDSLFEEVKIGRVNFLNKVSTAAYSRNLKKEKVGKPSLKTVRSCQSSPKRFMWDTLTNK